MPINSDTAKDIERLLFSDLSSWYPEFTAVKPKVVRVLKKEFRWSDHLIFTFSDTDEQHLIKIIVKVIHDHELGKRLQDEKISPLQRVEHEFQALQSIYQSLGADRHRDISAVRPLTYYPDHNALVLEYMPGENFLSLIQAAGQLGSDKLLVQRANQVAYTSGHLLGILHKISKGPYPAKKAFDFYEYHSSAKGKIDVLSNLGIDGMAVENLLYGDGTLNNLVNHVVTYSFLHGDYYPENIVQKADGRLYTIDTTLHQTGPVEQDVAKFLIGVELSKRRLLYGKLGMKDVVSTGIKQSFLKGYQEQNQYNSVVLTLMKILAALQRWVEIMEVIRHSRLAMPGALFTQLQVKPAILDYLTSTLNEIRENSEI